jgi:hypothetical protein
MYILMSFPQQQQQHSNVAAAANANAAAQNSFQQVTWWDPPMRGNKSIWRNTWLDGSVCAQWENRDPKLFCN